ncbi:hypothetical protein HMPREF0063_11542 [Aeromicrobium marinum DSM 15272]|uniref:Uncharacterized protein n=1 Tax=Aeromicrobium marinum DSM 15272 TaxID=585531 RepID=E2SBY3_9ACTN|nr:hypothetical protein [Aeromicrobium marinum]EFQ83269.1 hypothetical protein HMPREF0063_11542 [Aeromicrobium marinum DSM 15272]
MISLLSNLLLVLVSVALVLLIGALVVVLFNAAAGWVVARVEERAEDREQVPTRR